MRHKRNPNNRPTEEMFGDGYDDTMDFLQKNMEESSNPEAWEFPVWWSNPKTARQYRQARKSTQHLAAIPYRGRLPYVPTYRKEG
jgi:hypothetical protein